MQNELPHRRHRDQRRRDRQEVDDLVERARALALVQQHGDQQAEADRPGQHDRDVDERVRERAAEHRVGERLAEVVEAEEVRRRARRACSP